MNGRGSYFCGVREKGEGGWGMRPWLLFLWDKGEGGGWLYDGMTQIGGDLA